VGGIEGRRKMEQRHLLGGIYNPFTKRVYHIIIVNKMKEMNLQKREECLH
jgi:hypothetical protein